MRVATVPDRSLALLLALAVGAFLAAGFVPVSQELVDRLAAPLLPGRARILAWLGCLAFPLLAAAFHYSFPRPRTAERLAAWWSLPLPVTLAGLYGALDGAPGIPSLTWTPEVELAVAWTLIFAPIGEELLFRGWLYSISDRLSHGAMATATNPLPVAVWVSAIAFSLWHFQNWGTEPAARVLFQALYTLPAGLWLGWLRWRTNGLLAPVTAHILLNAATGFF